MWFGQHLVPTGLVVGPSGTGATERVQRSFVKAQTLQAVEFVDSTETSSSLSPFSEGKVLIEIRDIIVN